METITIMEIILAAGCSSLSGVIDKRLGYFIARRDGRFFSQRSNKMQVPPDGHWRFIVTCAIFAQNKYCIADIKVDWFEILTALWEAKHFVASEQVERNKIRIGKINYDARDILNLKTTFGL